MAKHTAPTGDEKDTSIQKLRAKIDPAGKIDPATGEKQFLNWQTFIQDGEEIHKAVGADGTVYKIVEDKPPVVKNYKLVIEENTGELPTTPIDPAPVQAQNIE